MSDFIAHWGPAAVRVSILLIVGTLVVLLCLRCAGGRIPAAGRSLLWLMVLALGLCWFTIPLDRPAWWPAWPPATAAEHDARVADTAPVDRDERSPAEFGWPDPLSPDMLREDALPPDPGAMIDPDDRQDEASMPRGGVDDNAVAASPPGTTQDAADTSGFAITLPAVVRMLFLTWLAAVAGLVGLFAFQHLSLLAGYAAPRKPCRNH